MALCVMEYTCQATATDCAAYPSTAATRANWNRLKSRDWKASMPRRGGFRGRDCMSCTKGYIDRVRNESRHKAVRLSLKFGALLPTRASGAQPFGCGGCGSLRRVRVSGAVLHPAPAAAARAAVPQIGRAHV